MSAGKFNIALEQGATFAMTAEFSRPDEGATPGDPISLAGATLSGKIRKAATDPDPAVATLTVTLESTPENNLIRVSLTDEETLAIPVSETSPGRRELTPMVYDVKATMPDGSVMRLLEGQVLVSPAAAR